MLKELVIFVVCFLCFVSSQTTVKKNDTTQALRTPYPELFRDHVYYSLSNRGKEMFYAVNVHPDCVAKKGQCIPRAQCNGREMLYISRICYKWDLVCCYDNSVKFPEVAWKQYTPPAPNNDTRERFVEPVVEPQLP